jgi:hypothetical protein
MIKDRTVARSHVIAWRKHLESRNLSDASIRRKLSALSRAKETVTSQLSSGAPIGMAMAHYESENQSGSP